MDLTKIKDVVKHELSNLSGIHSLQIQNHIYGCFILMEDIAEKRVELNGKQLVGPGFVFDIDTQFDLIGVRYGFIMDTQLILKKVNDTYKEIWLETFNDISVILDLEIVDTIEDTLIEVIQQVVLPHDAFFSNAIETGSLTQEWIDKVLKLLHPSFTSSDIKENNMLPKKSILSHANTETKIHIGKHRHFAHTRRRLNDVSKITPSVIPLRKKCLSKTRRSLINKE